MDITHFPCCGAFAAKRSNRDISITIVSESFTPFTAASGEPPLQ